MKKCSILEMTELALLLEGGGSGSFFFMGQLGFRLEVAQMEMCQVAESESEPYYVTSIWSLFTLQQRAVFLLKGLQ